METIQKDGKTVAKSKNLRVISDYARKHTIISAVTQKDPSNDYRGLLSVTFADGAHSISSWASFNIMIDWVRNRRMFRGISITHKDGDFGYFTAPGEIAGPVTEKQIKIIAKHYIDAALWADCPEGTHSRAASTAIKTAQKAVREFCYENRNDVRTLLETQGYGDTCAQDFGGTNREEWPLASLGHDLYLTSQGHGVGFLDRGLGELGQRLKNAAYNARGKAWCVEPEFYRGWLRLL